MNIIKEQEQFIQQLSKPISGTTKEKYNRWLKLFLEWIQAGHIRLQHINYNHLLTFIRHCKKQNLSTDQLNRILHVLEQYFAMKQKANVIKRNPVIGLKIKGSKKKLPQNLLDQEALDKLCEDYPADTLYEKRNKVILGLLVNQALTTGDLRRLKPEHLKLREGKIYIPAGTGESIRQHMNRRTLELKASQILELKEYLEQVRPQLNLDTSRLLFIRESSNRDYSIRNVVRKMSKKIRKYASHYRNVKQIRASVIAEWLKEKDVRIVQYMAGHVRVTSTERYQAVRLEDLQQALDTFHPLR